MDKTITINFTSANEAATKLRQTYNNLITSCFVVHWNNGDCNEWEEDEEVFFADSFDEAREWVEGQTKDKGFVVRKNAWVKIIPAKERWDGCDRDYEGEFYYIQKPLTKN